SCIALTSCLPFSLLTLIVSRPCKRCISVGKDDTCRDVEHKKRGRPKLVDKTVAVDSAWVAPSKDSAASAAKSAATAAALAKTRIKGKYTKSANYKMPKKIMNGAKTPTETFPVPQSNAPSRDSALQGRPSSYPSRPELERPSSALSYRTHPPSAQSYQSRPLSMHSEPPLPGDQQDPFYYSSAPNSTSQVKQPQEMYTAPSSAPLATIFLTMDLICARVSDESQVLWGYHPHHISHKSLYSIVANEDQSKMRSLLDQIKDAVRSALPSDSPHQLSHHSFLESSSPVFYQNRPGIMSSSAPGSNEYTDVVRICHADGGSDLFSVRMYVGGGLGADLLRGLNLEHAYIVSVIARHAPPTVKDHTRSNERVSLDESRMTQYNNHNGFTSANTQYAPKSTLPPPQRYSTLDPIRSAEPIKKISLPPIFTGVSNTNSPSLSSPSVPSPLSSSSSNSRHSAMFGSSAPLPNSSSYTVPLSKPGPHSSSFPSLRTGPLHNPRWLYESEPFGGASSHGTPSHRLPTVFSDPFRALSAPMGGFGVSKYLNRSEPSPSFSNVRRHQLPLPSPLQSSQGSRLDSPSRNPRSLQRDLSSSSFGASFASRSPPSSMKRPLADMADSQDRNRDIDNRHQDHQQHQGSRRGSTSTPLSSSLPAPSSRPNYQSSIKLELQSMPPDHPAIDPSSAGVCPVVHGSQQKERVQQAQVQANQAVRELDMKERYSSGTEPERGPCRWAKMADQWKDCRDNGPPGHDCFSPGDVSEHREHEREYGQEHERERDGEATSKGYFDRGRLRLARHHSLSPGSQLYPGDSLVGHFSPHSDEGSSFGRHGGVNPFSTGPSSPTEPYSHHRSSNGLRRTSSVGRSSYISRNQGLVICLSGACGSVCRCSGEDEEARAAKAMDAARKRMSVHSLLC
ncbi:hypothetical protein EDD21DRAFT_389533, partial [Dissophora ornata]